MSKGDLIVMRANKTTNNIYKILGSIDIGHIASFEYDNDGTKLLYMRHSHLSKCVMMKLICNCKMDLYKYYVLEKKFHIRFKLRKHKT